MTYLSIKGGTTVLILLLALGGVGITLTLLAPLIPDYFNQKKEKSDESSKKESEEFLKSFELSVNKLLLDLTEDEQKEIDYVSTQRELDNNYSLSFKTKFKLFCSKLFANPFASCSLVTLIIQMIVMGVIAFFISMSLLLPHLFPPLLLLLASAPISRYMYKTSKNELSTMESNFFLCTSHYNKYLSSSNFIESIKNTRNTFLVGTREYKILTKVYEGMTLNNMSIDNTLKYWGDLMLADKTILNYLSTITKCEYYLPEYKHAMPLILERNKDIRQLKSSQISNFLYFLYLSNFSVVMSIGILYYLRYFNGDPNTARMFSTIVGFLATFMIFTLEAICIWFVLVKNKPLLIDNTGYDVLIRKRFKGGD